MMSHLLACVPAMAALFSVIFACLFGEVLAGDCGHNTILGTNIQSQEAHPPITDVLPTTRW